MIYEKEKHFWQKIDAHDSKDRIHEIISKKSLEVINEVQNEALKLIE